MLIALNDVDFFSGIFTKIFLVIVGFIIGSVSCSASIATTFELMPKDKCIDSVEYSQIHGKQIATIITKCEKIDIK